jgi:hypothetical protein
MSGGKQIDLDQWIDAMAPVLRVEISDEVRAGVKSHLKTASKMAAVLERVPLRDDAEPAPIYRT